ncbi:MAG: SprT family zinc-dependent metalloprotease [Oscillospiraceae bacterium]
MTTYKIQRFKMKQAKIVINNEGEVIVRAPRRKTQKSIAAFVKQNEKWIDETSSAFRENIKKREDFLVSPEGKFLLLGTEYPVKNGEECLFDGEFFILPKGTFSEIKPELEKLYKEMADKIIRKQVEKYSEIINVRVEKISIHSTKSRWGSCNAKKHINFCWRLVMLPIEIVDYIVVHELCHIKQLNHSQYFWKEVYNILPDYKEREEQLKEWTRKAAFW